MAVLERLRSALLGSEEQRYSYMCVECQHRFESPEHNPNFTDCPDCGSDRIQTAI